MNDPFSSPDFVKSYAAFAKHSRAYSGMMNALLDMTSVTGKRVADVGAGTGAGIEPILARSPLHITALEPSKPMLEQLHAGYGANPLVTIVEGNAADLGQFGRFDVALSSHVFPYLENPREALQGVMSAADDWMFSAVIDDPFAIHGTDFVNGFMELLETAYERSGQQIKLPRKEKVVHPVRKVYSNADDVVSFIRAAGFDVAQTKELFDQATAQEFLNEVINHMFPQATSEFQSYLDRLAGDIFKRFSHPDLGPGRIAYQHHLLLRVVHKNKDRRIV